MRAVMIIGLAMVLLAPASASAVAKKSEASAAANPIRKVVTMLQKMHDKVAAEGAKETELYEKFMCYCKTSGGALKESLAAAEAKIPALAAELDETKAKHAAAEESLKTAQVDREAAKAAIESAVALREKTAAAFAKEKAGSDENIAAVSAAIAALKKGLGSFLQTGTARFLKNMILAKEDLEETDRDQLISFLSGGEDSPGTGQIIGILSEMKETMAKGLSEATAAEEAAIASTEELIAAKKKEIAALSEQIEAKTALIGDTGVKAVEVEADMSDTQKQATEDKKFLADITTDCATKTSEMEENQKLRSQELVAIADTIKILNDDDALDLFKKTLPSASSSFVQLKVNTKAQRKAALAKLEGVRRRGGKGRVDLNFIALAIMGKKIGFDKVIAMIDKMVAEIAEEQEDDDHKKEYCEAQIEETKTKVATLKKSIADAEAATAAAEEDLSTTTADIAALGKSIKNLDKSMAEATSQRKEESQVYTELMASDAAAKELLEFAKNRLNKFYNPILYKPPPTTTLGEMDSLAASVSNSLAFVQISAHEHGDAAPPPPPATAEAYSAQSKASTGVLAMIDMLIKDLDKEMDEAEEDEKMAQKDYEQTVKDAMEQRQMYSSQLVEKESTKAQLETSLQAGKEDAASKSEELMATDKYLVSVHSECDWLLQYFGVRAEARITETEALKNAKAVLSGADYSLVQVGTHRRSLRGVLR